MGPQGFSLRSSIYNDDIQTELEILAAYMSDPGFRPSLDAKLPTLMNIMCRTVFNQPTMAVEAAISQAADPDYPGNLPPCEVLEKMRSSDFERVLKPIIVGSPIELTVVGDLDEADAIKAISTTFGALPPRTATLRSPSRVSFMRYPDAPVEPIRLDVQGPADKAAAVLKWPLYVATPERRPEEYSLKLLAAVFDAALRQRIRTELGKNYNSKVTTMTPDFGDQGVLQVTIEASPRDIDALASEARAVANHLRAGEITPHMFEDARQPLLAAARANHETLGWWVAALGGSADHPAVLVEALDYQALISGVSLQDVRAAAGKWLTRDPIVGIAQSKPTDQPAK